MKVKSVDEYVAEYRCHLERLRLENDSILKDEMIHSYLLFEMAVDMRTKELKKLFHNINDETIKREIFKVVNIIVDLNNLLEKQVRR